MSQVFTFLQAWVASRVSVSDERGATMVEYGLMVALIAVVVAVAAAVLGTNIAALFTDVAGDIAP
jgi:pilus assembly protein Flp/PilA